MLVDTHAHLQSREFDRDRDVVIHRAMSAGVRAIINVGFDLETSQRALKLAQIEGMYATCGIHPHNAKHMTLWAAEVEQLIPSERLVAVGEIGLDYYRNLSAPEAQKECFARMIDLARRVRLPIVVHDRDAHKDILAMLKSEKAEQVGGVMHCFSGDWQMARDCLDMGFFISIAGPVTFKNSSRLQQVAASVPLDRLLIETDCPYLAPEPYRGMRCEPGMVRLVAERVASLRGESPESIQEATWQNAIRLFGLDKEQVLCAANIPKQPE